LDYHKILEHIMIKRLTLAIGLTGLTALAFGQLSTGPAAGSGGTPGPRYAQE
jgi:hypothetical protein